MTGEEQRVARGRGGNLAELLLPFVNVFRKLSVDQAGLGKHRGGVGGCQTILVHKSSMLLITPSAKA